MPHEDDTKYQGIVLLTDNARQYLNPKQEITYKEFRPELAEWMLNLGKNPKKAEGYSYSTAKCLQRDGPGSTRTAHRHPHKGQTPPKHHRRIGELSYLTSISNRSSGQTHPRQRERSRQPSTWPNRKKIDIGFDDIGNVTGDPEDNFMSTVELDEGEIPDIHFRKADLK